MSRFTISDTPIAGLQRIERQRQSDARGFFSRLFCAEDLAAAGWHKPIAQINHTFTRQTGAVRGMHFQSPPYAEMKLVNCLRGAIWDVAVDIRADSPTFLHWYAEELSAANGRALLIPEGFAHGFQALTDDCELLYFHATAYRTDAEGALNALDPRLGVTWPRPIAERSARDQTHPFLDDRFAGIRL